MTLTFKELEAVATELNQILVGARVVDLSVLDTETVVLAFDTPQGEVRVLICVRPRYSRIHRTRQDLLPARRRSSHPFLRASDSFMGTTVERVAVRFGDRVVGIEFSRQRTPGPVPTARGPSPRRRTPKTPPEPVGWLLFECTGHHPNLFWTDPSEVILATLVLSRSHRRDLRPGRRYQPPLPHPSDRVDSLRFMPTGPGSFSDLIEAHYERLGRDETNRAQQARARREVRREIERLERLREGLMRDLAEQERAAALLDGHEAPVPERPRLMRLAERRLATQERLRRVERRIERLMRPEADSPSNAEP